jgi:hypothetical protein
MASAARRSSRKFARYEEVLEYRRSKRRQGYKTGHIFRDWQGLYAFMYV